MERNSLWQRKYLMDWCNELWLKYWTIQTRIKRGWSIKKALFNNQ